MSHGINDWEETYDQAGSLYCGCGSMFRAVKYRWRGEMELRCSATCLLIRALRMEMLSDQQSDTSMRIPGGSRVD